MVSEHATPLLHHGNTFNMNTKDTYTATEAYQSREEPERLYVVAGIYWRTMLFVEILFFCIAVAVGAYLLVTTFFSFGSGNQQNAPAKSLNKNILSGTVQAFDARKDLFQQLEAGAAPVPDPSR
jgi:hypothetical protein